jgi:multiple sugar transport system substrate-binding protein
VQVATEAVITGALSPQEAAEQYDKTVRDQVGDAKVLQK